MNDLEIMKLKPVIKWAGGKRQILPELLKHFPRDFNNYHEPFLGGASVVLHLWNCGLLTNKHIYISDIMHPLVNLYNTIKQNPQRLILELSDSKYSNTAEAYNRHRIEFNKIKRETCWEQSNIPEAALFLYLNRICFNGMYRENSRGEFNVPFGKQKNPQICNRDSILDLHNFLVNNHVHLTCSSFLNAENNMKRDDFVYLDPPYYNTFTSYNRESFGKVEQIQLRDFFVRLTDTGCRVALSNSNDPFILELYQNIPNVKIIEIDSKRIINCKVDARGDIVKEILVCNY